MKNGIRANLLMSCYLGVLQYNFNWNGDVKNLGGKACEIPNFGLYRIQFNECIIQVSTKSNIEQLLIIFRLYK